MKKIYVVRKFVLAESVIEALQKERTQPVDDCWAEESTHKEFLHDQQKETIGFTTPKENEK